MTPHSPVVSPAGGKPGHERRITGDPGESVITQLLPGLTGLGQTVGSGELLLLVVLPVAERDLPTVTAAARGEPFPAAA